jgi:aminoglycoside phosphotransferase (APT) family kinase protein
VHRVEHVSSVPLIGWYTDPVGADRWAALLEASYDVGAPFADSLAAEVPHLVELEGLLAKPTALRTCHRDLWSENLAPLDDGGVCVIDWENSGLADPAQELPMALIDFCWEDPRRTVAFYAAYCAAEGPARLTRKSDFTMAIAQFGHFWEMAVEAYLAPDASAEEKSHSLGRIDPLVAAPLRLEHLEAVLDQVASVH